MKKFIVLLVTAVLIVSTFGVMTAFAGSASISISGKTSVEPGHTYTYKVTVKVSNAGSAMATISCSGIFTLVSIKDIPDFYKPSNASGSVSGSITVKVKSDAKDNETGTIRVSGQLGSWVSGSGSIEEKSIGRTLTAKVGKPSSGSTTMTAKATSAPTEWDIAATNVGAMQAGGAITVNITGDPKIPVSLLTSLKEKQGALTVSFGGYTCVIDGKSLGSLPDAKSIDLSMKMEKDESFSTAVGGKDAYQLHFAHSGQLPGKFSYSFKAENSKPGDVLYLYYYYSQPGVCEGVQSALVGEDGYVTFDIYHCSSYFVSDSVIEGAAGVDFAAGAEAEQALQEAEDRQAELQAQLEDAQNTIKELQYEIDTFKIEVLPEENPLTAAVSGPAENLFGVPYGSLIAAITGAALVSMFLTMLFGHIGIFKKRVKDRTDI